MIKIYNLNDPSGEGTTATAVLNGDLWREALAEGKPASQALAHALGGGPDTYVNGPPTEIDHLLALANMGEGELRAHIAKLEARLKVTLNLGQQMSTVCFNLSRYSGLDEQKRATLKDLQEQWDKSK